MTACHQYNEIETVPIWANGSKPSQICCKIIVGLIALILSILEDLS